MSSTRACIEIAEPLLRRDAPDSQSLSFFSSSIVWIKFLGSANWKRCSGAVMMTCDGFSACPLELLSVCNLGQVISALKVSSVSWEKSWGWCKEQNGIVSARRLRQCLVEQKHSWGLLIIIVFVLVSVMQSPGLPGHHPLAEGTHQEKGIHLW